VGCVYREYDPARQVNWVVYAKPPFAGAERVLEVLEYVGRCTHRVAIANNRIVDIEDGKVRFRWKDYRNENRQKVMTLDAGEFIRRFLVHVLPEGFQRIRYYGFLGTRYRKQKLARCRELLGMQQSDTPVKPKEGRDYRDKVEELTGVSLRECPFCRQGQMVCIEVLAPVASQDQPFPDTS
jgi:Putative transposase